MQIPVQISVKGNIIAGILHVPAQRAKGSPTIIMCYGLNGDRVEVHRMSVLAAKQAEEMGITFFRFDYRGLGLSDGEFWNTSIETKIEDTLAVIEFIKGCFQSEESTIILLGFCDGVRVTCQVTKFYEEISALAMWNPTFSAMPAVARSTGITPRLMREPETKELVYPFFGLWMGSNYLRQVNLDMDISCFNNFNKPKLLIFAENDLYSKVTRESFLGGAFQDNPFQKIITIPGAKHLFNSVTWTEQVIRHTLEWSLEVGIQKNNEFNSLENSMKKTL